MKFSEKLAAIRVKNKSLLCVGLDPDLDKLPEGIERNASGVTTFLKGIVDATAEQVCAYKPNLAFFEALGPDGLASLREVVAHIPDDIPVIGDAKRGDVGHTAAKYAEALFDVYRFDAVTLNPLLGYDSLEPFLAREEKCLFLLCLTSNPGAKDFELPNKLYLDIAGKAREWDKGNTLGLVVGATHPEQMTEIREAAGALPILVPGVGAQGGDLEATLESLLLPDGGGVIINVSRSVLYAGSGRNYADDVQAAARSYRERINAALPTTFKG